MGLRELPRAVAKETLTDGTASVGTRKAVAADLPRVGMRPGREAQRSREAPLQAADIADFSLSQPPPFDMRAPELLHEVLGTLPEKLRCPQADFEIDATSRESCLLVTHAFWYLFVSLQLPHLETQRDELLRLMAVQYARLTVKLMCAIDTFLDHFAPLVATVELLALRRHGALGSQSQQGPAAASVFRHLLALLGAPPLSPECFTQHMRFAERLGSEAAASATLAGASKTAASEKGAPGAITWNLGANSGPVRASPLGPISIPQLPHIERPEGGTASAAILPAIAGVKPPSPGQKHASVSAFLPRKGTPEGWGKMRQTVVVQAMVKSKSKLRREKAASTGQLLGGLLPERPYRPPRLACDLKRQSPLVAIFKGTPPATVLATPELVDFATRSGFGRPLGTTLGSSEAGSSSSSSSQAVRALESARAVTVRHSAPGVGARSRLGGTASFQALQPAGLVERSRRRLEEYFVASKGEDTTMLIFERTMESRCRGIDGQRDEKLLLPRPELADYTLELANHTLNPSPLRMRKD